MKKTSIHICPMSFGKAIALTNFLFAMVAISLIALIPAVDLKSGNWAIAMATPFVAAVAGLIYGAIGGTIYNMAAKKKGESVMEVREEDR